MTQAYLLPQVWTSQAACRGCPPAEFFPPAEDPAEAAKSVCRLCPVQDPCLDHALRYREAGVWGATTERERNRMHRAGARQVMSATSQTGIPKRRSG
jgi:WhiB family transcriptional regulator, redox-sensing transcriptional regulator